MYEADTNTVANSLANSGSPAFSDPAVIQTILNLSTTVPGGGGGGGGTGDTVIIDEVNAANGGVVTVAAGTDVVFITSSDTGQTTFQAPGNAPAIVFKGAGGVNVIIDDGTGTGDADSDADRVVIGSAGNDKIVIVDGKDTQVILGSGNSTVVAGFGDDTIVAGLGNSTIDGGLGDDVIVLGGMSTDYSISFGAEAATSGNAPESHGTSRVVVTHNPTGVTTEITGVQYVQLDSNDALIFASSTVEAGVAALYHAAFNRTGEFGGIDFWFDHAKNGLSLRDMATGFTQSAEFAATADMSDADFIQALYQNVFKRDADAGGLAYWMNQLSNGGTRADLLTHFASVAAMNIDGTLNTEAMIVGSVTIVHGIV